MCGILREASEVESPDFRVPGRAESLARGHGHGSHHGHDASHGHGDPICRTGIRASHALHTDFLYNKDNLREAERKLKTGECRSAY